MALAQTLIRLPARDLDYLRDQARARNITLAQVIRAALATAREQDASAARLAAAEARILAAVEKAAPSSGAETKLVMTLVQITELAAQVAIALKPAIAALPAAILDESDRRARARKLNAINDQSRPAAGAAGKGGTR